MTIAFLIMKLSPEQYSLNSLSEIKISMLHKSFWISRNIETIDFSESLFELLNWKSVVDWNNSSSSTLQELDMGNFYELL